jgi:hypothetical protein
MTPGLFQFGGEAGLAAEWGRPLVRAHRVRKKMRPGEASLQRGLLFFFFTLGFFLEKMSCLD